LSLLDIATIGLATYYLSGCINHEDGLFNIFLLIRKLFGAELVDVQDPYGNPTGEQIEQAREGWNKSYDFITCPWCVGLWVAIGLTALWYVLPVVVQVLGVTGLSVLLSTMTKNV